MLTPHNPHTRPCLVPSNATHMSDMLMRTGYLLKMQMYDEWQMHTMQHIIAGSFVRAVSRIAAVPYAAA